MKKKMITIIIIIVILLLSVTKVQAKNSGTNMKVTLPEDYINLTQMVKENSQVLQQYQIDAKQQLENYQKKGIVLDAINQEGTKTITIFMIKTNTTQKIENFSKLADEELTKLMEEYQQEKLKNVAEIVRQNRYVVGDVVYINTVTKDEHSKIVEEYYTIVDHTAISIILACRNGEMPTEDMKSVVNAISFNSTTELSSKTVLIIGIFFLLSLFVIIWYEIRKRKNKIEPQMNNTTIIQKIIQRYHLENNTKLRGLLLFFLITIIFSGINSVYVLINFALHTPILETNYQGIYHITVILQNSIQLILLGYILIIIRKKESKTKKKIQKTLLILLGISVITTIVRVVISILLQGTDGYLSEIGNGLKNILYLIIWYGYYYHSIRVAVYYQENTIAELVKSPKTRIQKEEMKTRFIETQIIDYFEEKGATDSENGIPVSEIPQEYAKNFYFSRLLQQKYLKVKQNKIYVNTKAKSTTHEKIRTLKIIGILILIYLCILLLIQGI